MKKILLISAILALSASSAFADILTTSSTQSSGAGAGSGSGSGSSALPPIYQALSLNQSIGNTSAGGFALNKATVVQAQVPVNAPQGSSLAQKLEIGQSIGDTSKGATAINKATVIQAQVPLNFGAP